MLIALPRVFGLTGNIGCGKTTVAEMLRAYPDVVVLYTDPLAKWFLNQEEGRKKLREMFGDQVFDGEAVGFRKLAQLIFSNLELKTKLEDFVHAWVKEEIRRQVWQIDPEKIVVVESALIFESNCRKLPAAALRGFANIFSPCFSAATFISSNSFLGIKISPRTSQCAG